MLASETKMVAGAIYGTLKLARLRAGPLDRRTRWK